MNNNVITLIIINIIIIIWNRMVNPRAPVLSCRASLARNLAGFSLASGNKINNNKRKKCQMPTNCHEIVKEI